MDDLKYKIITAGVEITHLLISGSKNAIMDACYRLYKALEPLQPAFVRIYFINEAQDCMEEQYYMYGSFVIEGDDIIPFYLLSTELTEGLNTIQKEVSGEIVVTIPLQHNSKLIGFIEATVQAWLPVDMLETLDNFGDSISIGLYTILHKRVADLERLLFDHIMHISAFFQAADTVEELLQTFVTKCVQFFKLDRMAAFVFDPDGNTQHTFCMNANRETSIIKNLPEIPQMTNRPIHLQDICGYWIPIISKDQVIGCILVDNIYTLSDINSKQLDSLMELCSLAGMNIENIMLFNNVTKMAQLDELTGVYNRRMGMESIEKLMRLSNLKRSPFVLCFIDLNDLKMVNDTMGHASGDEMLVELVDIIQTCIRQDDIISRVGGDEFIILFPDCTMVEAEGIWNRILEEMNNYNSNGWRTFSVGASHGMVVYNPKDEITPSQLMNIADTRMYAEKKPFPR